ncbi:MAG: ATP-dependent helicase [Dehalococcoidia bacterium]|nr:ATP-dependent helicase [Dehalococcoidia bacterium]
MSEHNAQQLAAITAPTDRPIMLTAGAGAGKTRVLVERIAYLVEHGFDPARILVTTFTKKATIEMVQRLTGRIGPEQAAALNAGTIHATCYKMLRGERTLDIGNGQVVKYGEPFTTGETKRILQDILGYRGPFVTSHSRGGWAVGWKPVADWIKRAKLATLLPNDSGAWFQRRMKELGQDDRAAVDYGWKLATCYQEYEKAKSALGKLDFNDMILWVALGLRNNAAFRARWQGRVDYVLVDEVQDTNALSMEVLETLAAPEMRLFATGDTDQSLYAFNGATPQSNIFSFLNRHPNGLVLKMGVNYRSTRRIVEVSSNVIAAQYEGRADLAPYRKDIMPKPDALDGSAPDVRAFGDPLEEGTQVAHSIKEAVELGRRAGDFAIIARTNAQLRSTEDAMMKTGIPYLVEGGIGFYDRVQVRECLGLVYLAINPADDDAFKQSANIATEHFWKATHGFGRKFMDDVDRLAAQDKVSMFDAACRYRTDFNRWQSGGIDDLEGLLSDIRRKSVIMVDGELKGYAPGPAVMAARALAYDSYLQREEGIDAEGANEEGILDTMDELVTAANEFKTVDDLRKHVETMRKLAEMRRSMGVGGGKLDAVTLCTVHRAKGREWQVVYGIGLCEGLLPHAYAIGLAFPKDAVPTEQTGGVADERCAAFVMVSRAQEELHLSYPMFRHNRPCQPSRFLAEMGLRTFEQEAARLGAGMVDAGLARALSAPERALLKELEAKTPLTEADAVWGV